METGRIYAPSASEIADNANRLIADEKNRHKPPKEPEVYADLTKLKIFRDLEEERDE